LLCVVLSIFFLLPLSILLYISVSGIQYFSVLVWNAPAVLCRTYEGKFISPCKMYMLVQFGSFILYHNSSLFHSWLAIRLISICSYQGFNYLIFSYSLWIFTLEKYVQVSSNINPCSKKTTWLYPLVCVFDISFIFLL